jgi:hypothetical protein
MPTTTRMKKSLLACAASCFSLLLFAGQADAKTFGGFKPKQSFTFTVTEKSCMKQVDLTPAVPVAVPPGIINLNLDRKLAFTIGKKGELKFKNKSLPFLEGKKSYNDYLLPTVGGISESGLVKKNAKGKPIGVILNIRKFEVVGLSRIATTVAYTLE